MRVTDDNMCLYICIVRYRTRYGRCGTAAVVCGSEGAECVRVGGGRKLTKDDFYVVSSFFSLTSVAAVLDLVKGPDEVGFGFNRPSPSTLVEDDDAVFDPQIRYVMRNPSQSSSFSIGSQTSKADQIQNKNQSWTKAQEHPSLRIRWQLCSSI